MKQLCRIFILFLCAITIPQAAFAQKKDSLWAVFANNSMPDTVRLKALSLVARSYIGNDPDSAIVFAKQQQHLAQQKNLKKYEATALTIMGLSFVNKGVYDSAMNCYLKALSLNQEMNNKQGVGNCYNNIGIIYDDQSNYPKALEYYFKALKIYEEIKNKGNLGAC